MFQEENRLKAYESLAVKETDHFLSCPFPLIILHAVQNAPLNKNTHIIQTGLLKFFRYTVHG